MNKIYCHGSGARFVLTSEGPQSVSLYPEGGGLHYRIPKLQFQQDFTEATPQSELAWTRSHFSINDGPAYGGYTDGYRWNGWACPSFTRDIALAIAGELKNVWYDASKDAFIFRADKDAPAIDDEVFEPHTISIDGKPLILYPIGDGWLWDEAAPPQTGLNTRKCPPNQDTEVQQ